tara:strand:+ start:448 stop:576 length:129 start_codon:yes stop_codon:yes gene_type:complete
MDGTGTIDPEEKNERFETVRIRGTISRPERKGTPRKMSAERW